MKTKLEMAHEYAIALINSDCEMQFDKFIRLCWNYADAMQAEADKREKEEAAQKRKEIREILNAPNTFVEREGQHFDDVTDIQKPYTSSEEWQPDKRTNPKPAITEQDKQRAEQAYANIVKPPIKEWQADWSRAPDWANWWAMDADRKSHWFSEEPYLNDSVGEWILRNNGEGLDNIFLPSLDYGYHSNWRKSLRKRPK